MKRLTLQRSEVPAPLLAAFPEYKGRKFVLVPAESACIIGTYWSGGSRSTYRAGRWDLPGKTEQARSDSPFDGLGVEGSTVDIPSGAFIAEHSIFRGRDHGLTFYVRPENLAPLLPSPADASTLTDEERTFLSLFVRLKAFARRDAWARPYPRPPAEREPYAAMVDRMVGRGMLKRNKAGAVSISPDGRRTLELGS